MKGKEYRNSAGNFSSDDFDIVFRSKAGKEYKTGAIEIDFAKKKIIIKQDDYAE